MIFIVINIFGINNKVLINLKCYLFLNFVIRDNELDYYEKKAINIIFISFIEIIYQI